MSFASPTFLWYFLPAALLLSWVLPLRARNAILAVTSLVFYAVGGGPFVLLLGMCIVVNYAAGLLLASSVAARRERGRRAVLVAATGIDVGVLAWWKYAGFASQTVHRLADVLHLDTAIVHVALPIGISFFTFHHLSYVIDVYRGRRDAMRSPVMFVTYIAMFPQLIAGPIVRFHEIDQQLRVCERDRLADFAEGFPRFAWGLAKKVLVADTVAPIADAAFATSASGMTSTTAWLGALAYTVQIYFDFSGYSDMAIGLGRMFGLRLPENFDRPYSAVSMTDFWRRWHMSLSRWFRDYLYIPLGGNRGGSRATYRNLGIVFFTTGLWHGAAWTYVAWGLYHGGWLVLERATGWGAVDGWARVPRRALTLLVVVVGWVIFRSHGLGQAGDVLSAMLVPTSAGLSPTASLLAEPARLVVLTGGLLVTLLPGTFVAGREMDAKGWGASALRVAALALVVPAGIVVAAGTFSPFLYFQF